MTEFTGFMALLRLILRRDRLGLLIWVALVSLAPIAITSSFIQLYPTAAALEAVADASMRTPTTIGMLGFVYSPTVGGLVAWRSGLQSAILIGTVSLLLVIRHTRTEEEAGRRELLGATVVGRLAPLTAALAAVLGANLVIAALIAGGLIGLGLPAAGSLALGLSAGAVGWVCAATGGVAAQLSERAGAARGLGMAAFAAAYMLRIIGDTADPEGDWSWLSWLSPLGWARLTRAFAGERWPVFALFLGLTILLSAAAFALTARRDLGAGLLPTRPGPAGSSSLRSPLGLAWRLHRGALIAWMTAAAIFGGLLGAVGQSFSAYVDNTQMNDWAARMGARDAGDAFLFLTMYVLGQVAAAYAISAALRMRAEETDGRAEPVLSAAISRLRWAGGHLFFATIGPLVVLTTLGLMIGLGYGLSAGDLARNLPRLLGRTLTTLPAVWVMAGLAAALYGFAPRLAVAGSWALLAAFLILELGWELQRISQPVFDISPFAHVHWSNPVATATLIELSVIAALLIAVGLVGLRRRDVG